MTIPASCPVGSNRVGPAARRHDVRGWTGGGSAEGCRDDVPFLAVTLFAAMNPTFIEQNLLSFTVAFWLAVRQVRPARERHWDFRLTLPVLFVLLAAASVLWSPNRGSTIWGVGALVLYLLAGAQSAATMTPERAVKGLAWGFRLFIGASLVALILSPATAFVSATYQQGAVQGVSVHRNIFGFLMAMALILFIYEWKTSTRRVLAFLSVAAAGALVVASRSQTSLLLAVLWGVILLVGLALVRSRSNTRGFAVLGIFAVLAVAVAFIASFFESFVSLFGRDVTLTGRTSVWTRVLGAIEERPWAGVGYDAVWGVGDAVGDVIRMSLGFSVSHAHNGYLNTALELGWLGAAVVSLTLAVALIGSYRLMMKDSAVYVVWMCLVGALITFNFVESRVTINAGWLILVLAYAFVSKRMKARARGVSSITKVAPGAQRHWTAQGSKGDVT